MALTQSFYGTGRRKTSSARVFIKPSQTGQGAFMVNHKKIDDYFPEIGSVKEIYKPLHVLGLEHAFDIYATVQGGGKTGQQGAIRLGLAKALVALEKAGAATPYIKVENTAETDGQATTSLYRRLRQAGKLTTTDTRQVERKKYGWHKARKKAQYSKR
jgi:small subunit ribosomal protein S9